MRAGRLAVPALLAAAPFVFFHELWLGGRTYLLRDLFDWFYPWRKFAADSLARGDFPLWNPYSYAGTPFLANMQSGLLYPPNVVFWLLDFPSALRLFLAIQFAMAAWFMHRLLRAQGCRAASSLAGGVAWAYGGWMIVHIEFPDKLAAAAWLPLVMLGLSHAWAGRALKGIAIAALATAGCVTAGYPQTAYTLLFGAGVLWCGAVAAAASREGRGALARAIVSMPAAAALGALIAAAQIAPFLEAISRSAARAPFEPWQVLELGFTPWHFLDLVAPRLFGMPGYQRFWGGELYQYWLGHFHVGVLTLGLAAAGLLARRPGVRRVAALLVLAVLLCLAGRTPVAPAFVAWFPGFAHFKWFATTSILIAFALCWLAALGLDRLLDALDRAERLPRALMAAAWAAAALIALCGAVAAAAPASFERLARAVAARVALPSQADLIAGNLGPARADAIRAGVIVTLAAAAWLACRAGRLKPSWFAALVPLAIFADLMGAAAGVNFAGDPAVYRETPSNVARLMARPDPLFRVYVPDATLAYDKILYGSQKTDQFRWAANTLLFNQNLPWRLFSASDGDPMWSARWRAFHRMIEAEGSDETRARLLSAANVAVVLKAAAHESLGPVGGTEVIDLGVALPRIYVAAGARRVPAGGALAVMADPGWDPLREALVEDDYPGEARPPSGGPLDHTVSEVVYTNNTVTFAVTASRRGYLVLGDAMAPGWRATIDGAPAPVFTANHLFRGIDLPEGSHRVRFVYRPASVLWGAAGSIAGLLIAAGLLLRDRAVARRAA